jgi:hypothetical protein
MRRALLLAVLLAAGDRAPAPVAIVAALSGEGWVTGSAGPRTPLRRFERLPRGSTIETGKASTAIVGFANGTRCEIGPGGRGTVAPEGLVRRSGTVRDLEPVAPFAPLLDVGDVGHRVAAVRLRGKVAARYPRDCVATLPDETVLRFSAPAGEWKVEVVDEAGAVIFSQGAETARVAVPPGVLGPGRRYMWQIRLLEATGAEHQDQACFVTLTGEQVRARSSLKANAQENPSLVPLLAELDRGCRLLDEARRGFCAALARTPEDRGLRDALAEVEKEADLQGEPCP